MTGNAAESTVWRALPGSLAASWPCGEDGVVFSCASGDTHRLDPLTFELYLTLAERPQSFDELVTALFDAGDDGLAGDSRLQVAQALRVLQALRLVEGPSR